ncbi:hypothetical protein [Patulibacter minatonensis]|uniref:hypothetical protein n=1 Tax=Patulibacter minatonensis TaxID=298163 RepID=UPI00047B8718|nr:hypothetical protein [Patulibacter minatonensis]
MTDDDAPITTTSGDGARAAAVAFPVAIVLSLLVGLATFAGGRGLGVNLAGYAIGCVAALVLVALYRRWLVRRVAATGVATPAVVRWAMTAAIVVGVLQAGGHAYLIGRVYG